MIGRNQRAQLLEAGVKPAYRRHVPEARLDEYRRYDAESGLAFVEHREKPALFTCPPVPVSAPRRGRQ